MAKFAIDRKYTDMSINVTFTVVSRSKCFVTVTDGHMTERFKIQYFSKLLKSGERIKQNETIIFGYGDKVVRLEA